MRKPPLWEGHCRLQAISSYRFSVAHCLRQCKTDRRLRRCCRAGLRAACRFFARWRGRVGIGSPLPRAEAGDFAALLPWPGCARPSRRGRFAPRTPRPYLSTAKDRGESSPRGHPPWQSPWGTPLLLGKRSRSARPCPTGARPHQALECPSRRQPPEIDHCRGS